MLFLPKLPADRRGPQFDNRWLKASQCQSPALMLNMMDVIMQEVLGNEKVQRSSKKEGKM
jgi:hypothetical protein